MRTYNHIVRVGTTDYVNGEIINVDYDVAFETEKEARELIKVYPALVSNKGMLINLKYIKI